MNFLPPISDVDEEQRKRLCTTLLAVCSFERELARERDVWELVVEKARGWVSGLVGGLCEVEVGKFWTN
jgi:hypothetical protein